MAARARLTPTTRGREPAIPADEHGELLERLVHDLRNPLGVVAYFAEVVSCADESERAEMCERLRINAQRALHILEEFSLLAELRQGACKPAFEACDLTALVCQLRAELELLERRPGQIRDRVDVRTPVRVPRAHLTCALRSLLREAIRGAARGDELELSARDEGRQLVFVLAGPLRSSAASDASPAHASIRGVDVELAERVAALYRGRFSVEVRAGRHVITLALPFAA